MKTQIEWIREGREATDYETPIITEVEEWLADKCIELDKQLQDALQLLAKIDRDCRRCSITYFNGRST